MSVAQSQNSAIALRELEMRSRIYPLDAQMAACIYLLQSPELVVEDLVRSIGQIRDCRGPSPSVALVSGDGQEKGGYFYPARELFVQGDKCSFTCLATAVDFTEALAEAPERSGCSGELQESDATDASAEKASQDCLANRIDYAAVTCEARPFPVLGFTQGHEKESAYPLLLRALSSLIELTRPRRFDLLDRDVYRGILGPAPAFDLTLVIWDEEDESDPSRPICELTRDLAEMLKSALAQEPRFPPVLNDIVCLKMNPSRFDARLRFVWRV